MDQIPQQPNQTPIEHPRHHWLRIIGIFFIVLVVIGLIVFGWLWRQYQQSLTAPTTVVPAQVVANTTTTKSIIRERLEKSGRPEFGNPLAKIVIVEFADFQCPYCTSEFPIIREIANQYRDTVRYIYRQYPIEDDRSLGISEAALCAHEQQKFWQFHDRLFFAHDRLVNDPELVIADAARQSGVNAEQFEECRRSGRQQPDVLEDAQDAVDLGVRGTPTFFINGNKLEGVVTLDQWRQIIDQALKVTQE